MESADISPSQMSYTFGKPLTETEFRALQSKDPSIRSVPVPLDSVASNKILQEKLQQKIRESQKTRQGPSR